MDGIETAVRWSIYALCFVFLVMFVCGCANHPVDVQCKGKGAISWIGPGGSTIQADCGDGFSYKAK